MIPNPSEDGDSDDVYVPAAGEDYFAYRARIAKHKAQLVQTAAIATTPPKITKKAVAVPFPVLWAGNQLPAPNVMLRSALFSIAIRGRREMKNEALPTQQVNGYAVIYDGVRLDQFDFDVWLTLVACARDFGLGGDVPITLRGIAERIGIGSGGKDIERVSESLNRMVAGTVILRTGPKREYRGHLVSWFDRVDDHYQIRIDERLVALFAADQFTLLMAAERLALNSALCKWLHGFISSQSQADKYPYKVESLRALCGSETKNLFHFRSQLREALADLQTRGIITSWSIDPEHDLVKIKRAGSSTQQRAVEKAERKANRAKLAQLEKAYLSRGGRGEGLGRL